MFASRISILAATTVALVILVDLIAGQGPPILNSYRQPLNGPPPMGPMGYRPVPSRQEYEPERKELEKEEFKAEKHFDKIHHPHHLEKEKYKESEENKGFMGSISDSMSGAWKSITGRKKRSLDESSESKEKKFGIATGESKLESTARTFDDFDFKHSDQGNYIYFKVARNLVCYS